MRCESLLTEGFGSDKRGGWLLSWSLGKGGVRAEARGWGSIPRRCRGRAAVEIRRASRRLGARTTGRAGIGVSITQEIGNETTHASLEVDGAGAGLGLSASIASGFESFSDGRELKRRVSEKPNEAGEILTQLQDGAWIRSRLPASLATRISDQSGPKSSRLTSTSPQMSKQQRARRDGKDPKAQVRRLLEL